MKVGEALAAKRGERGLTIQQAASATRIQADYLKALEEGDLERLPAPVYAKGYLRTYARYLGLDPEPLAEIIRAPAGDTRRQLSIGKIATRPRLVITAPAMAAVGLVLLCLLYTSDAADDLLCVDLGGRRIIK